MDATEETNPESLDGELDEEFALRPSTMPAIGIDLSGFPTSELANAVGAQVHSCLCQLGKILNLKRLMRVIVAYDFEQVVAGIERGTAVSRPLAPTKNGIAVGIAMTPTVLQEGEPRSVMVLNANYASVLAQPESPEIKEAVDVILYTLAHESAHVHDLDVQVSCFPDVILKKQLSFREGILFSIASGCWEEYIACRLSAPMAKDVTLRAFEETLCCALERAKTRADGAIRQYRMHGDVDRVTREVTEEYKGVVVYCSYLLGHADGLERKMEEIAPKATHTIESHAYFKPVFAKLHAELLSLFENYGQWPGIQVFEPLMQLADDLLKVGGTDILTRPDGTAYVTIPFRPETMPTPAEQMAFLLARNTASKG